MKFELTKEMMRQIKGGDDRQDYCDKLQQDAAGDHDWDNDDWDNWADKWLDKCVG